ncbi:hypothetical protein HYFRA_00006882 [Hymenoscyphus fraxineus]|uniref:Uncharacterized protein n=1 Tax=Hymenoscyphus fraxineus TaxID=746836 RepID=A0A9N9PFH0_9HELO|nr:hypothetical protein HYFRA_00006882 [Hymenoscyphus fraxineus]
MMKVTGSTKRKGFTKQSPRNDPQDQMSEAPENLFPMRRAPCIPTYNPMMGNQSSTPTPTIPSLFEDFEEILPSEVLEHPEPNLPTPPGSTTITTPDLEKLYKFSESLLQQHTHALSTIRTHETSKLLTHLTLQDLTKKQDHIHTLCTRLAAAHSLDSPVGIPEEGILSYMLDCIENLQRPLDTLNTKLEDAPKTARLSRKILARVTHLEDALLHDSEELQQDGILGYLGDEIFNLIQQVGSFSERFEGFGGRLRDVEERMAYLHSRVDTSVKSLAEIREMQTRIGDQILEAEGNVRNSFVAFQDEMHQRLDVLEGRVESLGTLKSSKSMGEFVDERLETHLSSLREVSNLNSTHRTTSGLEPVKPPSKPRTSRTILGEKLRERSKIQKTLPIPRVPANPPSPRETSPERLITFDSPPENTPPDFPEQTSPKRKFPHEPVSEDSQSSSPTNFDNSSPNPRPITYTDYTIRPKPTSQKDLPPFIPPSKASPDQSPSQNLPVCLLRAVPFPSSPQLSADTDPFSNLSTPTTPALSPETITRQSSTSPSSNPTTTAPQLDPSLLATRPPSHTHQRNRHPYLIWNQWTPPPSYKKPSLG